MMHNAQVREVPQSAWYKSSYSSSSEIDSCVEIAVTSGTVHVRDSKDVAGPGLALSLNAWTGFVPYAAEG
ncbi:DUF397 domain-containing protein [Streptomyces sp. NPDC047000]|uniref:DUF397 domain-containing protein n=1 Tax=Streptomyces sp. NPDC047000 TaxID=3155474 RepID=UPI0033FAE0FC